MKVVENRTEGISLKAGQSRFPAGSNCPAVFTVKQCLPDGFGTEKFVEKLRAAFARGPDSALAVEILETVDDGNCSEDGHEPVRIGNNHADPIQY